MESSSGKNRKSVKISQNYGHEFVVSRFWPTLYNDKNHCHNCKQHQSSAPTRRAGLSLYEMCTSHELKGYVVYVSIFYRFLDMAGYLSKVADFDPPQILLLLLPRRG